MKTKMLLLVGVAALTGASLLRAEKIVAGPKGGRLLDTKPLQAEFLVTPDRKVEIHFYDAALKPAAPGPQVVTVTAEPPAGRAKLDLDSIANGYVSKTALPAGEPYRVVVQIRATPDTKPQNFRIDLNLAACGECQRAEYACICTEH